MGSIARFILTVSSLILPIQLKAQGYAGEKRNFTIHLDKHPFKAIPDNSIENHILDMLKYRNIYVDKYSTIQIQETETAVDLSCFNCIIQRMEAGAYVHSPDNLEVFVP